MTDENFGIRVLLPEGDPLSEPHLLGNGWSSERWYATEEQRDTALRDLQDQPPYYRQGDRPSIVLEKISR